MLEQQEVMSVEDIEVNLFNEEIYGVSYEAEIKNHEVLKKKPLGLYLKGSSLNRKTTWKSNNLLRESRPQKDNEIKLTFIESDCIISVVVEEYLCYDTEDLYHNDRSFYSPMSSTEKKEADLLMPPSDMYDSDTFSEVLGVIARQMLLKSNSEDWKPIKDDPYTLCFDKLCVPEYDEAIGETVFKPFTSLTKNI